MLVFAFSSIVYTEKIFKFTDFLEASDIAVSGNEIKEIFLPDQEIFTINDGIYYYLKRDENDVWVLYSEKIF